jgi:citrate synthase
MKDVFANKIPIWQAQQKEIKAKYGDKILGTCTVEQAYGGMRSVKSMVYETSLLDPVEVCTAPHLAAGPVALFCALLQHRLLTSTTRGGFPQGIRFRGLTIPECQKVLPKAKVSS